MGELWVNYAELADAIGEDGAEKLCRAVGGVSTYIPRTQPEGSPLCGVIGTERMRRLCSAFGGLRVTLPNRRRSEPSKVRIARLLESGKAPGAVALEIGRTPAQLRILAEDWAEDLAAFPRDIVERAVKAHRRESPYFPTVADIWRRCGELRRGLEARREAERALPGRTLTRDEQIALNTDWCAKILANLRGKMERGKRGDCGRAG